MTRPPGDRFGMNQGLAASTPGSSAAPGTDWPPGRSEMAALVRRHHWAGTSLGPIEDWPQSLRTAVELMLAAPQPVYIAWGPEHTSLYNDGHIPILAARHPRALGRPYREVWPEIWEAFRPILARTMAGQAHFFEDQPVPLAGRPGRPVSWFTFSWTPLCDDSGAVAGVFCMVTETTDKMLAAAALRESERRLQIALEAADLGTWDLDLVGDRAVRSLRHDQMFGYAQAQSEWGRAISERHVLTEDLPVYRAAFERAVESGILGCEVRVRWPDGTVHWIAPLGRTYYDEAGRAVRMAGVVADVTERKQTEERLRLITAVARDYAVFVTDAEGRITEWLPGAQAVFGWSVEEAIGQPFELVFTPEDRAAGVPQQELDTARREGYAPDVRWLRRRDGSRVFIVGSTTALHDAAGRLQGFMKIGQDTTERHAASEALREADRRKDEFLAMLAHELRNPLAPLVNAHQLLERTEPLTERGRAALGLAQRQTRQLRRLVDDLLEISRITRGKIEIRPEPMSIGSAVHAAVETVAPLIEQRAQRIEVGVPPAPLRLKADPARIAQVLENLLTNASKYTPAGGSIRIEVEPHVDAVVIRVVDDGVGIEPAKLADLFQVFHQLDATLDRAQGGLGIGLALVKRLVELHGGSVSATSRGLGKGSTFTVRLPLQAPERTSDSNRRS